MAVGAHLDLVRGEALAGDLDEAVALERGLQLAAVGCGERGLHLVDLRSEARAERAEVRHHRPAHEAREGVDVVEGLHVQLVGDLGAPRCGELDAGVEEQRAPQRLADLCLRLGAGGATDGDEAAHGLHLGGEGGVAGGPRSASRRCGPRARP